MRGRNPDGHKALMYQAANTKKQTFREQFSALRYLPKFLEMIWHANPYMALGNIVLRLAQSVMPLLILYIGKEIIDEVIALVNGQGDQQALWVLVGAEFILAIVSDLISRVVTLLDSLLGDLMSNKSSEQLMRHASTLDLYQFEDPAFYDKMERARRQTTGRTSLMAQVLSQAQDSITVLFLGAGLVAFNPWLILILVVAVIPAFLGESHFNQKNYSLTNSWTPERRELDYLRYIGASDETAKEVKVFNLTEFLTGRFKEISHRYYLANSRLAASRAVWGGLLSAIGTAAYYAAYLVILFQTINGLISIGSLTFLAGSFERMRSLLQRIMNRFSGIAEQALYLKDWFDFFEIQPTIGTNPDGKPVPLPFRSGFTFENVSFQYPNSGQYAIRGLSFHLKAGEKLALVGENGAGKTTLVKLLARLYEPTEGRILLDGVDLKEYNLASLRNAVGVIFQDFIRFQLKAAENIAVGNIVEKQNTALIKSSASKSLANTVVENLPKQFDQMLGKRFADGVELSGGQWQKIALARAYMRDAQLLILDEPTSALDARAEHEVFQRFSELITGKTAVLISHRFSTVRMADRILFLENGQLREMGTHEELISKNGMYAELFNLQAAGYQ